MVTKSPRRSSRLQEADNFPNGCSGASKLEDAKENSSGLQKQNSDQRKVQGGDDEEGITRPVVPRPKSGGLEKKSSAKIMAKNLFDVTKHRPQAIKQAAQNWVKQYQDNSSVATAQILNFLAKGCGCPPSFTASVVEKENMDSLLDMLQASIRQTQERDPLKGKGSKLCRKNFSLMWKRIVLAYNAAGLAFDDDLVNMLSSILVPLTRDSVRCFRFMGSLAVCELVKAWLEVVHGLMDARETAQRHLSAEEKKASAKRARERKSMLESTVARCHQQVFDLKKLLTTFVDELLTNRYRDIDPEIRSMVISTLGCCCNQLPTEFLTTNYLKHIAWALSDRDGGVRLEAVKTLIVLYDSNDSIMHLKDFTERFKDRICMLVNDINEEVAVASVRLVTKLVRANELSTDAICKVYKLLLADVQTIRHAAAELVCELLNDEDSELALESSSSGSDEHIHGLLKLMDMLASIKADSVAADSGNHPPDVLTLNKHLVADLVDALHDRLEVLQNLDGILRWLKDESQTYSCTPSMQTHLVLLLESSTEKIVGVQGAPGDDVRQFKRRVKTNRASARVHEEITLSLMREIGSMLSKFQAEQDKIPSLVKIIQFMKLDLYTTKSDKESFSDLLRKVASLYFKHHDRQVLDSVVLTLVFAATHGPQELQVQGRIIIEELLEEILESIDSAGEDAKAIAMMDSVSSSKDTPPQFLGLQTSIARLQALLSVEKACCLKSERIYSAMNSALDLATTCLGASEAVIAPALQCFELALLWDAEEVSRGENTEGEILTVLVRESGKLMNWVSVILNGENSLAVCWEAAKIMVDLYMVWSIDKVRGSDLVSLGFDLDRPNFLRLWEIVEEKITQDLLSLGSGAAKKELDASLPCWVTSSLETESSFVDSLVDTITVVCKCVAASLSDDCIIALGGCLTQFLVSPHDEVVNLVRATLRQLRKASPTSIGALYSHSMQVAFESALGDDGSVGEAGRKHFLDLCKKFAQTFVTSHAATTRSCVVEVFSSGVEYGVKDIRGRAHFLEGCMPFIPKAHPSDAKMMVARVQELSERKGPDEDDEVWSPLFTLLDGLKVRAASKYSTGGIKRKGTTDHKDSRRAITFADDHTSRGNGAEVLGELKVLGDDKENEEDSSLQVGSGISNALNPHNRMSGGTLLQGDDVEEYLSPSDLDGEQHSGSDSASINEGSGDDDDDGSPPSTPVGHGKPQGDLSSGTKRIHPAVELTGNTSVDNEDMEEPPPRPKRARK